MARTPRTYPIPKAEKRGNSYRIRWYSHKTLFEISLGSPDKHHAQAMRTALEAAFSGHADFPEEIVNEPVIKRFRAMANPTQNDSPDAALIDQYLKHITATCTSQWPLRVRYFLNKALAHIGTLQHATPTQLLEFLDIIATTISPASRNRAQISLSGFYRWMRTAGLAPKHYNPLEGIRQAREERPHDGIVIWEKKEIPALLKAADERKDGIAVWIAILAGLRREEIARLKWTDIAEAYIIVGKSKTGKKRQVPLSNALAERLKKEKRNTGKVVPWPEKMHGWQTAARRLVETFLPKLLPNVYEKHPEKFGWNPFRHTFASRHAQQGLSLDIIASWMGHSPKVCREHYARYVPKNARDKRIDAADPKL